MTSSLPSDSILAKAFSIANANEQAAMLNAMARELYIGCRGKSNFEMQLCFMSDHLNADGIALINSLHDYVKLRKEPIA